MVTHEEKERLMLIIESIGLFGILIEKDLKIKLNFSQMSEISILFKEMALLDILKDPEVTYARKKFEDALVDFGIII